MWTLSLSLSLHLYVSTSPEWKKLQSQGDTMKAHERERELERDSKRGRQGERERGREGETFLTLSFTLHTGKCESNFTKVKWKRSFCARSLNRILNEFGERRRWSYFKSISGTINHKGPLNIIQFRVIELWDWVMCRPTARLANRPPELLLNVCHYTVIKTMYLPGKGNCMVWAILASWESEYLLSLNHGCTFLQSSVTVTSECA